MLNENHDFKEINLDEKFFEEISSLMVENHKINHESSINTGEHVDVDFSDNAALANATLTLTSSTARDNNTKKPVIFSKKIPLSSGVNWLTIIHRNPNNSIYIETEIILNGKIVLKKQLYNQYAKHIPSLWVKKYPKAQYGYDIGWIRQLNFYSFNQEYQQLIWNRIHKDPKIKKDDLGFIRDYQKFFQDNIKLQLTYPQGKIEKTETIAYANGIDPYDYPTGKKVTLTDFEYVQSFAIVVRQKVSDTLLKYWTAQKSKYPIGHLKAAYGTFLSALVTIQTHDTLADKTAQELGIKWNRPKTILVMNGIKHNYNYLHIPDNTMGMISTGDINQKKTFNYACSSMLSVLEDFNLNSMAFPVNSVLIGTGQQLMGGKTAIIQEKAGEFEVALPRRPNIKIQIDPKTWHVKDIIGSYKGSISAVPAYCYQNRQTDLINRLADNILNHKCEWLGILGSLAASLGSSIFAVCGKGKPIKDPKNILGGLVLGLGVLVMAYDQKLHEGINLKKALIYISSVALAIAPGFEEVGPVVGELKIFYVGINGIKREVAHIPAKFEGYVLSTMKLRPGDVFIGRKVIEPIYVANVQYIKYGSVESVIKTAYGNTPSEAAIKFVKEETMQKGFEVLVNNYNVTNDTYTSKHYENILEYINKP